MPRKKIVTDADRAAMRRSLKALTSLTPLPEGVNKPFYIAKPEVVEGTDRFNGEFSLWGQDTLADVTAQAESRARKTGKAQYIVQVVRVVRPQPIPVTVEDVRA